MRNFSFLLSLALVALGSATAKAGDFDGSKPLLCAVTEAIECGPLECQRIQLELLNLPSFLHIDFEAKRISGRAPDGVERSTAIERLSRLDDAVVLQGVEARAWSLLIRHQTGGLTLSASGADAGFVIFGACTARSGAGR